MAKKNKRKCIHCHNNVPVKKIRKTSKGFACVSCLRSRGVDEKTIATAVPIIAGVLIAALGFPTSIGFIGIFTIGGVILFTLIAKSIRYNKTEKVLADEG